jgi:Zn-dependent protease with chaperone function
MNTIPLDMARAVAASECEAAGVTLITPESLSMLRLAAYLTVTATTPLTLEQARERVSLYVPRLAADLVDLARLASPALGNLIAIDRACVVVGDGAWNDGALLAGVIAHELGHHRRDVATRGGLGVVGSALWGLAYLAHPAVRLWEEGTCYTCDVTAAVILRGVDPLAAGDDAERSLRSIYRADPLSLAIGSDAIRACVASLRARQLHGVDTSIHRVLRALVKRGWDAGAWAAVIGDAP